MSSACRGEVWRIIETAHRDFEISGAVLALVKDRSRSRWQKREADSAIERWLQTAANQLPLAARSALAPEARSFIWRAALLSEPAIQKLRGELEKKELPRLTDEILGLVRRLLDYPTASRDLVIRLAGPGVITCGRWRARITPRIRYLIDRHGGPAVVASKLLYDAMFPRGSSWSLPRPYLEVLRLASPPSQRAAGAPTDPQPAPRSPSHEGAPSPPQSPPREGAPSPPPFPPRDLPSPREGSWSPKSSRYFRRSFSPGQLRGASSESLAAPGASEPGTAPDGTPLFLEARGLWSENPEEGRPMSPVSPPPALPASGSSAIAKWTEGFSNPFNSTLIELGNDFCSLWPVVDRCFGARAGFFDLETLAGSNWCLNPPFIETVLAAVARRLAAFYGSPGPHPERVLFLGPRWPDAEFYALLSELAETVPVVVIERTLTSTGCRDSFLQIPIISECPISEFRIGAGW